MTVLFDRGAIISHCALFGLTAPFLVSLRPEVKKLGRSRGAVGRSEGAKRRALRPKTNLLKTLLLLYSKISYYQYFCKSQKREIKYKKGQIRGFGGYLEDQGSKIIFFSGESKENGVFRAHCAPDVELGALAPSLMRGW